MKLDAPIRQAAAYMPWWAKVRPPQDLRVETHVDALNDATIVRAIWHDGVPGKRMRFRIGEVSVQMRDIERAKRSGDEYAVAGMCMAATEQAIIAAGITPWERKSGRVGGKWRAWLAPRRRP